MNHYAAYAKNIVAYSFELKDDIGLKWVKILYLQILYMWNMYAQINKH